MNPTQAFVPSKPSKPRALSADGSKWDHSWDRRNREIKAHPERDAHAPKRIPPEVQMQQSVTTQNTLRRIPSLCSTTGVCWRNVVSANGAGAVIRRLLPTSAVLCRPPANVPYIAVIGRLLPAFADLKFLVQNSLRHSLNGGGAERQTDSDGRAARPLVPFLRGSQPSAVVRLRGEIMVSLMTEQEVSKRLNVSLASLRRWRLAKRGPAFVKVGALVRYSADDLDAWLASLPTGGTASHKQLASGPSALQIESSK